MKYINKDDTALPAFSLGSIFTICAIEAKESQDVGVTDLPGSFLHASNEKDVVMLMNVFFGKAYGDECSTDFQTKHCNKNEMWINIVHKSAKSFRLMLTNALLFYLKLRVDSENMWFKVNPYNPFVAHKTINGDQMTITSNLQLSCEGYKIGNLPCQTVSEHQSQTGKESWIS